MELKKIIEIIDKLDEKYGKTTEVHSFTCYSKHSIIYLGESASNLIRFYKIYNEEEVKKIYYKFYNIEYKIYDIEYKFPKKEDKMHKMKLNNKYFELMKTEEKNFEIRKRDAKREKIRIGDSIEFKNLETKEKLVRKVVKITIIDFAKLKNFIEYTKIDGEQIIEDLIEIYGEDKSQEMLYIDLKNEIKEDNE